ncbi:MAG: hypothetical protein IPG24_23625 [Leptospiraceae bacterium]|nr:hypothetical protein [Leptospiraceae bacterium]
MREDENYQVWLPYALSNSAVDTRYPIEIGEQPDENDYKEALALAESVYSWAQEKIGLL